MKLAEEKCEGILKSKHLKLMDHPMEASIPRGTTNKRILNETDFQIVAPVQNYQVQVIILNKEGEDRKAEIQTW